MKNIVTNTYSFERMIANDYVYVDKTALLWRIANESMGNMFFISRPRRFGKSLMLSTFKAMFLGRRDLFKGLKIDALPFDWQEYPILHFDMSVVRAETLEDCKRMLCQLVCEAADDYGIELPTDSDPSILFRMLLRGLTGNGRRIVVLIDEYDAPLSGALDDREHFEALRRLLHDFYVNLKAMDEHIRFLMMTGVSKFAKLSVFSGLNNLTDLTAMGEFATLLGYTEAELRSNFAEHLAAVATARKASVDEVIAELKCWYNGYRFSPDSEERVLNPVSVGRALFEHKFTGFWNSTGAATLIVERMRAFDRLPCDLENVQSGTSIFDACDPLEMPLPELLYQGGYLTIKEARGEDVSLCVPNNEVRQALIAGHIQAVMGESAGKPYCQASLRAREALVAGDVAVALEIFRSAFAALPYEWLVKDESAAKVAFLDFFNAMPNATLHAERETANGRIDVVVELPETICIFEFKCGASAEAAFDQIVTAGYATPYHASGKKVLGIGINYRPDPAARGIDAPVIRQLLNF